MGESQVPAGVADEQGVRTPYRRGWQILLAVGVAVGAGLITRARRRPAPPDLVRPSSPPAAMPAPPPTSTASRSLVRMGVGAGIVVVLALITAVLIRPRDTASTADPYSADLTPAPGASGAPMPIDQSSPMPLAQCQAAVAEWGGVSTRLNCGYETTGAGLPGLWTDEPGADPDDPQYAGAALPTDLSTDGQACVTGAGRPVVDTVRPTFSASFTGGAGLLRLESTFQLTGVAGPDSQSLETSGDPGPPGAAASLTLSSQRPPLQHGESYKWRVRATPRTINARGWSSWCEFTVAETTPDDLGLDDFRNYRVELPTAKWREIVAALKPAVPDAADVASTFAPIEDALKAAPPKAAELSVLLNGRRWGELEKEICARAYDDDNPAIWKLADLVSAALGGPERPTMGYERD